MERFEIRNDNWEEIIKYYFAAKKEMNRDFFVEDVNQKEGLKIEINENKTYLYNQVFDFEDFVCFCNNKIKEETTIVAYITENEWNCKIIFIETNNYYILRIWETSA